MFIASVSSSSSASVRPVQAARAPATRDVHGRRAGDAGADGRLGLACARRRRARRSGATRRATSGSRSTPSVVRARPPRRCSPVSSEMRRDAVVAARRQRAVRAQADRGVDRLRAVVKEIERPDVVGAAGEIDPRRRGRVDAHARIIMAGECRFGSFGVTPAGWRSSASAGHTRPDDLRRLVAEFDLGGVIYFARNIVEPRAGRGAVARGGGARARLAVLDQRRSGRRPRRAAEGAVHRMAAGDHARPERRRGARRALRARRSPPSCAPSASTSTTRPCSTSTPIPRIPSSAIARSPSEAEDVARLGAAIIRALQAHGVAACGKHFPGHGDTSVDSHEALPVVEHDRRRLDAVELVPFRRADRGRRRDDHDRARARAGARRGRAGVVFAGDRRPISSRTRSASTGVVISDDLGMKAVSATTPLAEATRGRDRRRLRRRAALQLDGRRAGGGDRGHHPRRRVRPAAAEAHRRRARRGSSGSRSDFCAAAVAVAGAARRRRVRRASGRRRRDGGVACDAAHRARASSSSGRCGPAAASRSWRPPAPFDRDGVRRAASRSSSGSGFEPVYDDVVFDRAGDDGRASARPRAWRSCARSTRSTPMRSSPCAAATAASRLLPLLDVERIRRIAHGVRRLQRRDVAAQLPRRARRPGVGARRDDRRPARGRARRRTTRRRFSRSLSAEPLGELVARRARDAAARATRVGPLVGRHAHAAAGVVRHAVRVPAAGTATCCSSTRSNERPYRIASHADAAAAERPARTRGGRSSSDRCRAATSRAAAVTARDVIARRRSRAFRGRCCSAFRRATRRRRS